MTSATQVLGQSVVVFSKNYLPVSRVNIKRAIALIVTGKAEPLDVTGGTGTSARRESVQEVRSQERHSPGARAYSLDDDWHRAGLESSFCEPAGTARLPRSWGLGRG